MQDSGRYQTGRWQTRRSCEGHTTFWMRASKGGLGDICLQDRRSYGGATSTCVLSTAAIITTATHCVAHKPAQVLKRCEKACLLQDPTWLVVEWRRTVVQWYGQGVGTQVAGAHSPQQGGQSDMKGRGGTRVGVSELMWVAASHISHDHDVTAFPGARHGLCQRIEDLLRLCRHIVAHLCCFNSRCLRVYSHCYFHCRTNSFPEE